MPNLTLLPTIFFSVLATVSGAAPLAPNAHPQPATGGAVPAASGDEMNDIRRSYVELRRDALLADSERLVPGNAEVAVYVSVDPRATVTLETASLLVNYQLAYEERYTEQQRAALRRDAADRLYVGALAPGTTSLVITFDGLRDNGKAWTQTADLEVIQAAAPRYVEFRLASTSTDGLPDIVASVSP